MRPAAHVGMGVYGTMVYMAFHFLLRGREWFTLSHGNVTDAAAAPSDASQSSVASDQLRTKKGARLRQATKPASAASPPACDDA